MTDNYPVGEHDMRAEITRLRSALTARDEAIRAQADHLRKLQPNWDSYGAPVINEKAVEAAVATALTAPHLTPCSSGGVQLDWQAAEITFGPDGEQEFDAPNAKVREVIRVAEDALRTAVEKAQHTANCRSRKPLPFGEKARAEFDGSCNCWKAEFITALSALAAAKVQG